MKQTGPGVGVSFKWEILTLGQNPDSGGLQLRLYTLTAHRLLLLIVAKVMIYSKSHQRTIHRHGCIICGAWLLLWWKTWNVLYKMHPSFRLNRPVLRSKMCVFVFCEANLAVAVTCCRYSGVLASVVYRYVWHWTSPVIRSRAGDAFQL